MNSKGRDPRRNTLLAAFLAASAMLALGTAAHCRNSAYQTEFALWQDVVRKAPHNVRGHAGVARWYQKTGQWEESLRSARRAAEIVPRDAAVRSDVALALWRLGRRDEALAMYETALRLGPDCPEAHLNFGNALRQSDPEAAIEHFRRSLQARPEYSEAHNNLGAMLTERDPAEAERHLRLAIDLDPRNADAHNNYANLAARRGRLAEAVMHYERALELRPEFELARRNLDTVRMLQRRSGR